MDDQSGSPPPPAENATLQSRRTSADSIPASPTVNLTYEQLLQQYESYRAKTKEWQSKVRERDVKMRAQLQASTTTIREQEEKLEELARTCAAQQPKLDNVATLESRLASAEAERQRAITEAEQKITKVYEEQLAAKHHDVSRLRQQITDLESAITLLKDEQNGNRFFDVTDLGATFGVLCRVGVDNVAYALACKRVGNGTAATNECRWFREEELTVPTSPSSRRAKFDSWPPTLQELYENEGKRKVEEALAARDASALQDCQRAVEEARKAAVVEREALAAQLARVQLELADSKSSKAAAAAEAAKALEELKSKHEIDLKNLRESAKRELDSALAELSAHAEENEKDLRKRIADLDEYKAKAQVALKRLRDASEGNPTPSANDAKIVLLEKQLLDANTLIRQQQETIEALQRSSSQWEAEFNGACEEIQRQQHEFDQTAQRRYDEMVASTEDESHRLTEEIRSLQQLRDTVVRELADAREMKARGSQSQLPSGAAVKTDTTAVFRANSGTQTEPTIVPVSPSVEDSLNNDSTASYRSSKVGTGGTPGAAMATGAEFDFGELLEAAERPTGGANVSANFAARDRIVRHLRHELSLLNARNESLQNELRDLAVSVALHVEQENVLKEQLRQSDRNKQRAAIHHEQAEYVKNVLLKFVTARGDPAVQRSLVPVLQTLLQLSPDEKRVLDSYVGGRPL